MRSKAMPIRSCLDYVSRRSAMPSAILRTSPQHHDTSGRMKTLIAREFARLGAKASVPFEVTYSDGTRYRNRDEPPRFSIRFRSRAAELTLAAYNHIGLLE